MSSVTAHAAEQAELDAVLTSGIFARSPRQAKLLSYICEEYFRGRADQIKEYNLATDVLERPAAFDQSRDAIVRVEVFRLRKKLKDYYNGEGASHAIHIVVLPGQYIPHFERREEAGRAHSDAAQPPLGALEIPGPVPVAEPAPAHEPRPYSHPNRLPLIGLAAVLVVGVVLAIWQRPDRVPATVPTGSPASPAASSALAPPLGSAGGVRILAGFVRGTYTDRSGLVWQGDRYFDGGDAISQQRLFIARTSDPAMFQTMRSGQFSYDIPLEPGNYELRLYFAETHYGPDTLSGGGETSRLFNVQMNGAPLLHLFDIIKDAGGASIADVRVFKDVHPASDGKLHLKFNPLIDSPIINAIEIEPAPNGKINPIRFVAEQSSYTAHDGRVWEPDEFSLGGQLATHLHRLPVSGTPDPDLYVGERFGSFNYAIPVPPGKYDVTLHFAETYWGTDNQRPGQALPDAVGSPEGGAGSRVFDVYFNGQTLLHHLDIFKEAGGAGRALIKTFHGLEPDAQGKLIVSFVPVVDYACVNAIEVDDASH